MATKNEASRLLVAWLKRRALTQAAFAAKLRVSGATVSRWASGALRPDTVYREAIERITDGEVPACAWLSAAEQKVIGRAVTLATGTEGR